jgi:peptidoglycan-N-acetylglucosamine deacetylase
VRSTFPNKYLKTCSAAGPRCIYRPPWLARTSVTFDVLADRGLRAMSGEFCHPLEPLQPSTQRLAQRALAKVRPGGILIFHDGYDAKGADRRSTVAAVKIVVDTLVARGYLFVTADRLVAAPVYTRLSSRIEAGC